MPKALRAEICFSVFIHEGLQKLRILAFENQNARSGIFKTVDWNNLYSAYITSTAQRKCGSYM
jgi:hypothetical protein